MGCPGSEKTLDRHLNSNLYFLFLSNESLKKLKKLKINKNSLFEEMTKTIRDILDTDNLNIRGTVLFTSHATCDDRSISTISGHKFFLQNYETQF